MTLDDIKGHLQPVLSATLVTAGLFVKTIMLSIQGKICG